MKRYKFFQLMENETIDRVVSAVKGGVAKAKELGRAGLAKAKGLASRGKAAAVRGKDAAIDAASSTIRKISKQGPAKFTLGKLRGMRSPKARKELSMLQKVGRGVKRHAGKIAAGGAGAAAAGGLMFLRSKPSKNKK